MLAEIGPACLFRDTRKPLKNRCATAGAAGPAHPVYSRAAGVASAEQDATSWLHPQHGAQVTAIDLAPDMITTARLHAAEAGLDIDYRVASAESVLADRPGSFDVVTCMEMLEHVPEPARMVATLAGLVRPGGALFLSTLNRSLRSWLMAIVGAEYVLKLLPRGTHEYDRLIRPAELARWARAAGLSLRELAGLELNPVTGKCRVTADVGVNYLAYLTR
jgi:2-polyprenyl-6-hydroxyphenyl methylase/3-demethylubiquinone-9 3-methyltransferase